MSHLSEAHEEIKVTFKWGTNTGVGRINKDIHFYNSFIYYDVEYLLYDYVYFYQRDYPEAFIGKLVKIYETPTHEKKVRVVWLFRPSEICNFLGDYEPRWNELFLASGEGKGISNINPLEAVGGKCNVVCMSKDPKNPQPSEAELRNADFIFCCTFDVGSLSIVKNFPDKIDGVKVEHYFNRGKDQKLINGPHLEVNLKEQTGKSSFTSQLGLGKAVRNVVSDGAGRKVSPVVKESKNAADTVVEQRHFPYINTTLRPKVPIGKDETRPDKISCNPNETNAKKVTLPEGLLTRSQLDIEPPKKRMSPPDDKETNTSCKKVLHSARCRDIKTRSQLEEVIRRPATERRNWFKPLPWEEELHKASKGTVVSLKNLDPSFTSSEVEDLVWHAFKVSVEAKMIQRSTFSSPHYGEALVVFKSTDAPESVLSKLRKECLMLADGRIVFGERPTLREFNKPASFVGHLVIDKNRSQRQHKEKSAVSTSHFSQSNTIEYDLAMDWRVLQERSDKWWTLLHEEQAKQIQRGQSLLRLKCNTT